MSQSTGVEIKPEVMGHPSQLFVIFFTEMWERFSYYGMRSLLIMFLSASIMDGGWGWPQEHAFAIFGTYVSLVYLSAVIGGWLADNNWCFIDDSWTCMYGLRDTIFCISRSYISCIW